MDKCRCNIKLNFNCRVYIFMTNKLPWYTFQSVLARVQLGFTKNIGPTWEYEFLKEQFVRCCQNTDALTQSFSIWQPRKPEVSVFGDLGMRLNAQLSYTLHL